jgi:hypothetical protein
MSGFSCDNCSDTGSLIVVHTKLDGSVQTSDETCQQCCEHNEHDHGICVDCGKDNYEDIAARAYDRAKYAAQD